MLGVHGLSRLSMLAVGLGIGATVAATPGVASADDIQISIDGVDLFPIAGNTATAVSQAGDMAIAMGNGAEAVADGGMFDTAFADGTNSIALAEGADVGGVLQSDSANFDTAIDIGNNTGANDGAVAGWFQGYNEAGNFDTAIDIGNNSALDTGPAAGVGNYDTAIDIDDSNGNDIAGLLGNNDFASVFGNNAVAFAGDSGNNDFASVFDPVLTPDAGPAYASHLVSEAYAWLGDGNIATVDGEDSDATAGGVVADPGGYTASVLGDNDIAEVFGNGLGSVASDGNSLIDIVPGL
jgi:hypothetical protein